MIKIEFPTMKDLLNLIMPMIFLGHLLKEMGDAIRSEASALPFSIKLGADLYGCSGIFQYRDKMPIRLARIDKQRQSN